MLFYYAKREGNCQWCKGNINRNDFCVKQFIGNKDSPGGFLLTFHYDCFIQATIEHIRKEAVEFISEHTPNKKIGRPTVYTDGAKADGIKHLLKYYRKKGNTSKILEYELELSRLIKH